MVETVTGLAESARYDVFSPGYGQRAFLYVVFGYMDGCLGTFLLSRPKNLNSYQFIFPCLPSGHLLHISLRTRLITTSFSRSSCLEVAGSCKLLDRCSLCPL